MQVSPQSVRAIPGWLAILVSVAAIGMIGVVDYVTGTEVRVFPLYFAPVAFTAWFARGKAGMIMAIIAAGSWVGSNWLAGEQYSLPIIWLVNFAAQAIAFGTASFFFAVLRRKLDAEAEQSRLDPLTSLPNSRAF